MGDGEVLVWVVKGLVREIVAGSLGLSKSSGKTSHTVSILISFSMSSTSLLVITS